MKDTDRMVAIAREIFSQVRTTIVMNMRFMDMAVFQLRPAPEDVTLATDGELLYYGPAWLLRRYRSEASAVTRDYFHVLLHCIFRHPFVHTLVNRELWDLACDIAVEGLICELDQAHLRTSTDARRRAVVDGLRRNVSPLTAEKLYNYFQRCAPDAAWAELFHADDHDIWHNPRRAQQMAQRAKTGGQEEPQRNPAQQPSPQQEQGQEQGKKSEPQPDKASEQGDGKEGEANPPSNSANQSDGGADAQQLQGQDRGNEPNPDETGGQGEENGEEANSSPDSASSDSTNQGGGGGNSAGKSQAQAAFGRGAGSQIGDSFQRAREEMWRDISEHVQMDLETFARQQGTKAGGLTQQLAELNRERYDYEAFLKKFAVMGEVMKVNDDEFDYIFYTYGLKLFGNMPLIEPLEYKEVKRIREFVIAIDTSGSTSGALVQRFLNKTYNILMSTQSFFSKVNVHIIQCDAEIQEDAKITSREEFEAYLKRMRIRGLGGTAFRPVFNYVDQLIHQREFKNLKGLIYFTDGRGTFPAHKPDYATAFVFVQNEYNNLDVPPWAIKLILQQEEI